MKEKKICVFTGSRSEYGLLLPLLKKIQATNGLRLQLVASGMHLSHEFGSTYHAIEEDRVNIDEKIEMLLSSDTPVGMAKSIGLGIIGFADAIKRLSPDLTIVLGDRFEALAFAVASYTLKVPVGHIHGGEITEGALDEGYRHAITKLSYLHFTAAEAYRERVIQLGEDPDRVFNVGSLSIDRIKMLRLLSKDEFEHRIKFELGEKNLLVTLHPETFNQQDISRLVRILLSALDDLENAKLIFTGSNSDTGGREINRIVRDYVEANSEKAVFINSMGSELYLSAMQFVDAVVGNSSSGLIEAPYFRIGTINIGDRQKGRIRAKSVIDCEFDYDDLKKAFDILYSDRFVQSLKSVVNPYGSGDAARKIVRVLKNVDMGNPRKRFYDMPKNSCL